jgi:UDP-N-acetylglucosamine 4,6-dehydratase
MSHFVERSFSNPVPDLSGASVLVTGGTGSFSRAFCDRLLSQMPPRWLIVFSRGRIRS